MVDTAEKAAHATLQKCAKIVAGQLDKLAKADDLEDAKKTKFDLGSLKDLSEGEFAAYMSDAGQQAAVSILGQVGLDESDAEDGKIFNVVNKRAIAAVRAQGAELVSQITEATRNMLRTTIANALQEGVSRKELIKRIVDSDAFSVDRAKLIASTEIRNANEKGVLAGLFGAQDAGSSVKKEWLLGPDPCLICQENADEGPIDLDADFPSGDSEPTAHPNCQCGLTGVIVDEDNDSEKFAKFEKVARVSMAAADYVDQAQGSDCCVDCMMFREVKGKFLGACTKVEGDISPRGHCKYFYPEEDVAKAFDPDQPRDERGRWTSEGGSIAAVITKPEAAIGLLPDDQLNRALAKRKANGLSELKTRKDVEKQLTEDLDDVHNRPSTASIMDTPERVKLQGEIADKLDKNGGFASAPKETIARQSNRRIDMVLGPPASGKSSYMVDDLLKEHGAMLLDSDEAKKLLPEFDKGAGSGAVHVESAKISENLVMRRAVARGDNIVEPLVGKNLQKIDDRITSYLKQGYQVHVHYVDLPLKKALQRSVARYIESNKLLDPAYVASIGTFPRQTYDAVKLRKDISSYDAISTDVGYGEKAKLIERHSNA